MLINYVGNEMSHFPASLINGHDLLFFTTGPVTNNCIPPFKKNKHCLPDMFFPYYSAWLCGFINAQSACNKRQSTIVVQILRTLSQICSPLSMGTVEGHLLTVQLLFGLINL